MNKKMKEWLVVFSGIFLLFFAAAISLTYGWFNYFILTLCFIILELGVWDRDKSKNKVTFMIFNLCFLIYSLLCFIIFSQYDLLTQLKIIILIPLVIVVSLANILTIKEVYKKHKHSDSKT